MIISPEMHTRIDNELETIESENNVSILFACESGSRAWGFPSQDSDYDVRMVYHHTRDWYLQLAEQRDVIEKPIIDELNISGWDLDKTLRLLRKSNPNILEWVNSPVIYREHQSFSLIRELLSCSFNHRSSLLHYLNMALNNKRQWLERDHIKIKKYLYALRPLLCAQWVIKHDCQPPMLYHELLSDLHPNSHIQDNIEKLVAQKVDMNELDTVPKNDFLNQWIDNSIAEVNEHIPEKMQLPNWDIYDQVFRDIIKKNINKDTTKANSLMPTSTIWTITLTLLPSNPFVKGPWQATIELDAQTDLEDLHYIIQKAVSFENDHLYEFYTSRDERSRNRCCYNDEIGNLHTTPLESLYPLAKSTKLYYLFDFGDDWTFVIGKSRKKPRAPQDNITYPRVVEETGTKPIQYPAF